MITYALDSNIISYILRDDEMVVKRYRQEASYGSGLIIPPIVCYEIRRGLLLRNSFNRLYVFEKLCQEIEIGVFDISVWLKAAEIFAYLQKRGRPVSDKDSDADIFIAAYCLINDYTLVTDNSSHFERIDGLKYDNWKQRV
ncbi:MAG: PIN domain-containing protein [Clostridiales bacterium]|jgi:tRNA(fMet)-specific endonuclease VapC|nr:PIN domain-containing protein [Clostridiales bacterium]